MMQCFKVEHEVLTRDSLSIHAYKTYGKSVDDVLRNYYKSRDPYRLRSAPVVTAIAADETVYGFVRKVMPETKPVLTVQKKAA